LRYETAWLNERLLANLLAPVGGGPLSQHVSQQEYSRLFEADRFGISSSTEYAGNGEFRQIASQFGTVQNLSYALDLEYLHFDGYRPNNQQSRIEWFTQLKQQLTPQDSAFILTKYQDSTAGDILQRYDPAGARPNVKFSEFQDPILLAGYHREWDQGLHTILLAGRLVNDVRFSDVGAPGTILNIRANAAGQTVVIRGTNVFPFFDLDYRSQFEAYTAELNQICQNERQTLVFGGRFNTGAFKTRNILSKVDQYQPGVTPFVYPSALDQSVGLQRKSFYGYHTLKLPKGLLVTAGFAYDNLTFPENFRSPPISSGQTHRERLSPKAALMWNPAPALTLRGVYTRSLGGVSFDESIRLEPTQLAGFNQGFRSIISESIVGAVSAPTFETRGAAMDFKLQPDLYLGVQGEILRSQVLRTAGVFDFDVNNRIVLPSSTSESLAYRERSLTITLNKLISVEWALGAQYRFTESQLRHRLPAIAPLMFGAAQTDERADLHQLNLQVFYNHPSGFFARADEQWYLQRNSGYAPGSPELNGADFQQLNLFAGYRLRRQRGEVALGLLNVTDQDYRLNPLTPYLDLPHKRAVFARLKFNF
jgi:hypothetical protein